MTSNDIRQKFLDFFAKKGHTVVPSASLIPENDPSVLFTTAGMQQFKPYYLGTKSPYGNKTTSCQKCVRTSDINEVGDETHLTFFEMLGNFSFQNAYFKQKAIEYAYEFISKTLKLKIDFVSVFEGTAEIPSDKEAEKIWEELDSSIEIRKAGLEDNFWGPTGEEGPCGPTTEIYINGTEIWNIVFNEYFKDKSGNYNKLEQPGVDTGMGLERLAMIMQNKPSIFETDLFTPLIAKIKNIKQKDQASRPVRIMVDHLKAAVFIIMDGERPSNLGRGYILRRLIRNAVIQARKLGIEKDYTKEMAQQIFEIYKNREWYRQNDERIILKELEKEEIKFSTTLERGLREFEKMSDKDVSGREAFMLFSTYGFPLEMTQELAKEKGVNVNIEEFKKELKKHQALSRTAAAGMFKSGLAETSEETIKLHTATHLLLAALRKVLGKQVTQKGSNITSERLRLDFSYPEKLTDQQKQEIENLVNQKIAENLSVKREEMTLNEAREKGALGVFESKYGEKVKVYSINGFSREICAGPHVEKTGKLGHFKILKEEASSAGVRRIKAILK
jgi:alanyl-tRNA synthetase